MYRIALLLVLVLGGCATTTPVPPQSQPILIEVTEEDWYYLRDDMSGYLETTTPDGQVIYVKLIDRTY